MSDVLLRNRVCNSRRRGGDRRRADDLHDIGLGARHRLRVSDRGCRGGDATNVGRQHLDRPLLDGLGKDERLAIRRGIGGRRTEVRVGRTGGRVAQEEVRRRFVRRRLLLRVQVSGPRRHHHTDEDDPAAAPENTEQRRDIPALGGLCIGHPSILDARVMGYRPRRRGRGSRLAIAVPPYARLWIPRRQYRSHAVDTPVPGSMDGRRRRVVVQVYEASLRPIVPLGAASASRSGCADPGRAVVNRLPLSLVGHNRAAASRGQRLRCAGRRLGTLCTVYSARMTASL